MLASLVVESGVLARLQLFLHRDKIPGIGFVSNGISSSDIDEFSIYINNLSCGWEILILR